jgi:hypothetical protein
MHVVIDAPGLKVHGAGKWLVESHGERGTRMWRKLHLAVDPSTGEVLVSEWTTNEKGDASQLGPVLGQIPGLIASVTADGAYDSDPTQPFHARGARNLRLLRPSAVPSLSASPTHL